MNGKYLICITEFTRSCGSRQMGVQYFDAYEDAKKMSEHINAQIPRGLDGGYITSYFIAASEPECVGL